MRTRDSRRRPFRRSSLGSTTSDEPALVGESRSTVEPHENQQALTAESGSAVVAHDDRQALATDGNYVNRGAAENQLTPGEPDNRPQRSGVGFDISFLGIFPRSNQMRRATFSTQFGGRHPPEDANRPRSRSRSRSRSPVQEPLAWEDSTFGAAVRMRIPGGRTVAAAALVPKETIDQAGRNIAGVARRARAVAGSATEAARVSWN